MCCHEYLMTCCHEYLTHAAMSITWWHAVVSGWWHAVMSTSQMLWWVVDDMLWWVLHRCCGEWLMTCCDDQGLWWHYIASSHRADCMYATYPTGRLARCSHADLSLRHAISTPVIHTVLVWKHINVYFIVTVLITSTCVDRVTWLYFLSSKSEASVSTFSPKQPHQVYKLTTFFPWKLLSWYESCNTNCYHGLINLSRPIQMYHGLSHPIQTYHGLSHPIQTVTNMPRAIQ